MRFQKMGVLLGVHIGLDRGCSIEGDCRFLRPGSESAALQNALGTR